MARLSVPGLLYSRLTTVLLSRPKGAAGTNQTYETSKSDLRTTDETRAVYPKGAFAARFPRFRAGLQTEIPLIKELEEFLRNANCCDFSKKAAHC